MSITLVINTLNEEENIADCINSASKWVDEIIVCDMYSDDKTVQIASSLNAKIFLHERTGYAARYFAISKASCEWVLVLDADEKMTEELGDKLRETAKANAYDLVLFGSLYNYFGGEVRHGGFFSNKWPRFFKLELYLSSYNEKDLIVHRDFANVEKAAKSRLQLPKSYYIHHNAYPTIEKYISKTVGMYGRIEAEEMVTKGSYKFRWVMLVFDPVKCFVMSYFVRQGFRDGIRGLVLCYFYASYRFSVWAHVWITEQKKLAKNG